MTQIQGTPIEIALWFVPVGEAPPATANPLERAAGGGTWATTLFGAVVLGMLPASQQAAAATALDTPLDQIFGNSWDSLLAQGTPQQSVQQAVKSARPNAYNIDVTFPPSGTLDASAGPFGLFAGLFGLPPAWAGSLLTLQYALDSPVAISWHETTNSIFGSWADPSYKATFDGTLEVLVAVPTDPTAGLSVNASFQAANIHAGLDGFSIGNVVEVIEIGWDLLTGQSVPSDSIPNQNVSASVGIQQSFNLLSVGFGVAAMQGFNELGVQVTNQVQAPAWPQAVWRVEFDLRHPFDPGPTAQQGQAGIFQPGQPQISASPSAVPAGSNFNVTGVNLPAQSTELTVGWTDTTSGPVAQSEVQWGKVLLTLIGQPLDVQLLGDQLIARSGPDDGRNTFTATGLAPGTRYAFRIRDYDVFKEVATAWGDWLVLTTSSTAQVQLVLSDVAETVLTTTTVQSGGSISAAATMPPGEPPGTYTLWAIMDSQKVAATIITVLAKGAQAPAQIEVFNPDTGITVAPPAGVVGEYVVSLRGYNFEPGIVDLYIDSLSGLSLGTAVVGSAAQDPTGYFAAWPTWPNGADGPHSVVAVQSGNLAASVPVYGQNAPS